MLIQTTRFGTIDVDGERIITFDDGLLGFNQLRRFALIQTANDPAFFWLQSVDDAGVAFVVCDPALFVPDYEISLRKDDLELLGMGEPGQGQVLAIVNKVDGNLTANLLGPLLVATNSMRGRQLVLSDRRYGTRHRLTRATQPMPVAKTA